MNITRLNYSQSLPFIKKAISQSHFMSFDLEMTGIVNEELLNPSIIDSMQLRYVKQKQSVYKYIPLQFGLSTFKVDLQLNKIVAYPFNFYIFPLTLGNEVMRFSFHAGTMNFLTKNNFDFNKLFYEGIPYISEQQLNLLKKKDKIVQYKRSMRKLQQLASPQSKAFIAINLPKVTEWIQTSEEILQIQIKFVKYQSYMNFKQKIESLYPEILLLFSFDNEILHRRSKMIIKRGKIEEKINTTLDCEVKQDYLFNEVVTQIENAKKPIIVHNGFLDLMHVYLRLYGTLPNQWHEYKDKINSIFPHIYDNKYFFNQSPTLRSYTSNQLTSLESCYAAMRGLDKKIPNECQIQIDQNFVEYKLDNLECHEAGFDSLMTGYSFLKAATVIGSDLKLLAEPKRFSQSHKLFRNRIPQGSIKVPFNFQANDQDIYTKDGNNPIYFRSILNSKVQENAIKEYFSKNFGPVNFLWSNFDMTEFCVIFISEKNEQAYKKFLQVGNDRNSSIVTVIEGLSYLVLNHLEYQQSISRFIQNLNEKTQTSQII